MTGKPLDYRIPESEFSYPEGSYRARLQGMLRVGGFE